jgi:DNA replication protein DnaC
MEGYLVHLAARRKQRTHAREHDAENEMQPIPPAPVCPHCGGAGYVRVNVPMGHPSFGQPVPCSCKEREFEERRQREEEIRLSELDRFFSLKPFSNKTFETFDTENTRITASIKDARLAAWQLANGATPGWQWLVLMGSYGTGKTHLAAAIAHYRLERGSSVYFAIVPELLDHLRAAFAPNSELSYDEMFDRIREVELLVLDDLGAENNTAWATEKLFQLINYRYNYRLPTVITTNQRLHSQMDERIRSRLSDASLVRIADIKGTDYRPSNVANARRAPRR